ncbi:MAG TPA: TonB-dependent receptor [Acidobacteriota bacterium]|nr:TonB-dependent receptor [Acidobacteriota bacterium]
MKFVFWVALLFPLCLCAATDQAFRGSVSVLTREQMDARKYPFVIDVLRSVPGVEVLQAGSPGRPAAVFIRGAAPDQTIVLIDGVQINEALVFTDLSALNTADLERIEIYRGPQSARFGSQAMGGAIAITTRSAGPLVRARAEYGSDHTRRLEAGSGVGSEINNISADYARYLSDGESFNDDLDNETFGAGGHLQIIPGTGVGFVFRDWKSEGGIPQAPTLRTNLDSKLFLIPVKQQILSNWTLDAGYSEVRQTLTPSQSQSGLSLDLHSRVRTFNVGSSWNPAPNQTLTAGYVHDENRSDAASNFGLALPRITLDTDSGFAEYTLTGWHNASLAASIRYDKSNVFGSITSPRIEAFYEVAPGLQLRGSGGRGFRFPTAFEMQASPTSDLKAETVTGWDLGTDYTITPYSSTLSATFFHQTFKDQIIIDSNYALTNAGQFRTSGVEFEAGVTPIEHLRLLFSYTLLSSENAATGNSLALRTKNSGNINVDYRFDRLGLNFNWNLIGARPLPASLPFLNNDSYQRADLVVSYRVWRELIPYVRFINLFDRTYQETPGIPSPDHAVFAGVQFGPRL